MLVSNPAGTSGPTCNLSDLSQGQLFIVPSQPGVVFEVLGGSAFSPPSGSAIVKDSNGTVSTLAMAAVVIPRQGLLSLV